MFKVSSVAQLLLTPWLYNRSSIFGPHEPAEIYSSAAQEHKTYVDSGTRKDLFLAEMHHMCKGVPASDELSQRFAVFGVEEFVREDVREVSILAQ